MYMWVCLMCMCRLVLLPLTSLLLFLFIIHDFDGTNCMASILKVIISNTPFACMCMRTKRSDSFNNSLIRYATCFYYPTFGINFYISNTIWNNTVFSTVFIHNTYREHTLPEEKTSRAGQQKKQTNQDYISHLCDRLKKPIEKKIHTKISLSLRKKEYFFCQDGRSNLLALWLSLLFDPARPPSWLYFKCESNFCFYEFVAIEQNTIVENQINYDGKIDIKTIYEHIGISEFKKPPQSSQQQQL